MMDSDHERGFPLLKWEIDSMRRRLEISELSGTLLLSVVLLALVALVWTPAPTQAGTPGCLCCWEEFDPWPNKYHIADTETEESCVVKEGDAWVEYGHGTHLEFMAGSCQNGTYHGLCGGADFASVMELLKARDTEGLLADDSGYVQMASDGSGLSVLDCDRSHIVAWLPISGSKEAGMSGNEAID